MQTILENQRIIPLLILHKLGQKGKTIHFGIQMQTLIL